MLSILYRIFSFIKACNCPAGKYALLFLILLIATTSKNFAANRFAVTSGSYNGSIWATTAGGAAGSAGVPTASDQVTINASSVVNITAAAAAAILTVSGTLNFNSGFDLTIANAGHVSVMSGGALIFDANGQIVGGGTNANGVAVKINNGATVTTANATGLMVGVNNTTLTGSIATNRGSRSGPTYNVGVDYIYNSATAQNMGTGPTTMSDLTITNAGVISASGSFTSTGVVTINSGATLSMGTRTLFLNGGGTPIVNSGGTFSAGTGTVNYNSASAQNIVDLPYNNLTTAGSAKSIAGGIDLSVGGNWVIGAPTTMNTTANANVTGVVSGTGGFTITSGTLTIGGTGSAFSHTANFGRGTGTVVYNRAGTQTVRPVTYNNLTLAGTSAKTTTTITVNGTLSMEGSATASAVPTYGTAAALVYSSTSTRTAGVEWAAQFTPTGGITVAGTGAVTIGVNKIFQAGAPLIINTDATLTTGNSDIVFRDDFINNGSWTTSTGDITVNGTIGQSIGGFSTTGAFISTKTGASTATLTGDIIAASVTINGSTGTVNLGVGLSHSITGTVTLTSGSLNGGSSTLRVRGTWAGTGTLFQPNNSTVILNGPAQTLSATGTKTFYNLTVSGTGAKTTATTTVNNILSIETVATMSAAPTFGANAAIQYNTITSRTSGNEWPASFTSTGGVTISATGTITLAADKLLSPGAAFTIMDGATFNASTFDMSFSDDFINNGTWTDNSGDVKLRGTATQSIAGFTTTGTFSMLKPSGTATLTGNATSDNFILNGAAGILNFGLGNTHTFATNYNSIAGGVLASNSTMNLDGTLTASGGTFDAGTGTVNFRGNVAQAVVAVNWYNIGFSGSGLKTFTGNSNVFGNMTVYAGASVDLAATTLQLGGSGTPLVVEPTATVDAAACTVAYLGATSTTIIPLNYLNLIGSGTTLPYNGDRVFATTANINIAGLFTPGGGAFTVTGSTVDFNGTTDQNIPTFTFDKLIVSNNGIKKILANVAVACTAIDINDAASVEINADGLGSLTVNSGP